LAEAEAQRQPRLPERSRGNWNNPPGRARMPLERRLSSCNQPLPSLPSKPAPEPGPNPNTNPTKHDNSGGTPSRRDLSAALHAESKSAVGIWNHYPRIKNRLCILENSLRTHDRYFSVEGTLRKTVKLQAGCLTGLQKGHVAFPDRNVDQLYRVVHDIGESFAFLELVTNQVLDLGCGNNAVNRRANDGLRQALPGTCHLGRPKIRLGFLDSCLCPVVVRERPVHLRHRDLMFRVRSR